MRKASLSISWNHNYSLSPCLKLFDRADQIPELVSSGSVFDRSDRRLSGSGVQRYNSFETLDLEAAKQRGWVLYG